MTHPLIAVVAMLISLAKPDAAHPQHLSLVQTECLAQVSYFEARGEPLQDQIDDSYVVIHRAEASGQSLCDVVHQKGQFSFYNKEHPKPITEMDAWKTSVDVAIKVQRHEVVDRFPDSMYFNNAPFSDKMHVKLLVKSSHQWLYASSDMPKQDASFAAHLHPTPRPTEVEIASWKHMDVASATTPAINHWGWSVFHLGSSLISTPWLTSATSPPLES